MPTYMYKAVNKSGLVVRNRVESSSRQGLIKMLKNNHSMPIEIQQISYISKRTPKKQKKNVTNIQEIMKKPRVPACNFGRGKYYKIAEYA